GPNASITSPRSAACRSPTNPRSATESSSAIACVTCSINSARNAPSSSRVATTGAGAATSFSSSMSCPGPKECVGLLRSPSYAGNRERPRHSEMIAAPNRHALRPVRSPQEWAAYHAIRRQAIFAALLPDQAYDENDPDEVAPGNFPHVLLRDGEI